MDGVAVNTGVGMGVSVGMGVGVASGVLWPHAAKMITRIRPSRESEKFRCTNILQKLIWPDYTLTAINYVSFLHDAEIADTASYNAKGSAKPSLFREKSVFIRLFDGDFDFLRAG